MKQSNWTWEEYATIRSYFPYEGADTIKRLEGRRLSHMFEKASLLHTSLHKPFSEEEKDIAETYGRKLGKAIIFFMPSRTSDEVEELLCVCGIQCSHS